MIDVLDDLADSSVDAHSSIVLAYNVDLLVYDKLLRRRLASAGAANQIVFCDATAYAASLDAVDEMSRVGRAYSVTPVRVEGAFHPKVYMLLGRRRGRLVVGSGNASLGGLVRNAEVFGRFEYDADTDSGPHPAFLQIFELTKRLSAMSLPAVQAQLKRAEQWTPWLTQPTVSDGRVVRIGGAGQAPLMDAIHACVKEGTRRIIALSSSFDRKLNAVEELTGIGGGNHRTYVVVQPDRVKVDGRAVARIGDAASWTKFIDKRLSKKKEPHDSFAHAKLILVETRKADYLFFGSANLSRPALLTGDNVEVVVQLPSKPPGTWLKYLGLSDSLEVDVRPDLLKLRPACEPEQPDATRLQLCGVEWSGGRWTVVTDREVPTDAKLALGNVRTAPDQLLSLRHEGELVAVTAAVAAHEGVRFGWLVSKAGTPLTEAVAVTWPDVTRVRLGGWFGARVEQAILSMKHGELLGHVLFEFLDRVPDLGVMAVAQIRNAMCVERAEREPTRADDERTDESFYTDTTASSDEIARLALGDRSDLDLLAALVQPLGADQTFNTRDPDEDDDEDDDEGIQEEAERRSLDTSKSEDGSERVSSTRLPTAKRMRVAGGRFERRIDRASTSLGETLSAIDDAIVLPPGIIARQVWMTFIAAFIAGRPVETSDEGELVVVESYVLAHYVLHCATSLAGDGRGGLLRHVDVAAWQTREGQTLADGLTFMIAVGAWAVAWFEDAYKPHAAQLTDEDEEPEYANWIHEAIPLFVLARFIGAVGAQVAQPDFTDAARRVSAWEEVRPQSIASAYHRARTLADWLAKVDANPESAPPAGPPKPGGAVSVKKSGVGIVVGVREGKVRVAMLGRPSKPVVRFAASMLRSVAIPNIGRLLLVPVSPDLGEE